MATWLMRLFPLRSYASRRNVRGGVTPLFAVPDREREKLSH